MSTSSRPRSASRCSCCRGATASWRAPGLDTVDRRPRPPAAAAGRGRRPGAGRDVGRRDRGRRDPRRRACAARRAGVDAAGRELGRPLPRDRRASATSPGSSAPICRPASPAPRSGGCGMRCCLSLGCLVAGGGRHVLARPAHGAPGRAAGRGRAAHPEARARRRGRAAAQPHQRARPAPRAPSTPCATGSPGSRPTSRAGWSRQLMANPSPDVVASRQLEVTVLFTDIVGFSRLAEQLDAHDGGDAAEPAFRAAGRLRRRDRRHGRQVPGRRDDGVLGRARAAARPRRPRGPRGAADPRPAARDRRLPAPAAARSACTPARPWSATSAPATGSTTPWSATR